MTAAHVKSELTKSDSAAWTYHRLHTVNCHTCPGCYEISLQLLLTQADVVVERKQEVIALLPVVAARCTGAPWSHVGCGVVKVVGSYCASCREMERSQVCMSAGTGRHTTSLHVSRFTMGESEHTIS